MSPQPSKRERRDAARANRLDEEQAADARAARKRRLAILGAIAAAVVVAVVVIAVATGGGDSGDPPEEVQGVAATQAFMRGLETDGDTLGDPKAPVTLVEYADLQCPICKAFSQEVLPPIVDQYVRTGKVRLQLKVVAILGEDSVRAQRFSAATEMQDKLWFFTHLFFENQGEENSGYVTDDFLRRIGSATPGLDVDKAFTDQDGAIATRIVNTANRAGIDSTPTFKIGTSGGALREIDISDGPQAIITALQEATR